MAAIGALAAAERIELLVTRAVFPEGQPNGVSLARMARIRRPGVKILFVARPENQEHTEGVGEFLATPTTGLKLVEAVDRILTGGGAGPIDELKAEQAMMAEMHARELAVAQHDALAAQQAAAELRQADEARKSVCAAPGRRGAGSSIAGQPRSPADRPASPWQPRAVLRSLWARLVAAWLRS